MKGTVTFALTKPLDPLHKLYLTQFFLKNNLQPHKTISRINADPLIRILRLPKTSEYFISALPVAGVDGTLKHRMYNIARKIRAKTGTISGVASLAGYATAYNKEQLAFVIMVNGNKGLSWRFKGMEDKIATALTRYVD